MNLTNNSIEKSTSGILCGVSYYKALLLLVAAEIFLGFIAILARPVHNLPAFGICDSNLRLRDDIPLFGVIGIDAIE